MEGRANYDLPQAKQWAAGRLRAQSLFQDDQRANLGLHHSRGCLLREWPVYSRKRRPGRSVSFHRRGQRGQSLDQRQEHGLFHLHGGKCGRTDPLGQAGTQGLRSSLCSPILCRAACGLDFLTVAWLISRTVRFAHRTSRRWVRRGPRHGLQLDRDGTLWAATEGGLSRVKDGRVATLTSRNGLPCDTVHWMMEDDDHSFWLYMACGLVRIARPELDAWVADPKRTIQATVFDSSDGVRSHASASGYSPRVAKSADGKIWFLPCDGVSVIDPRHLPFNKLPPPVHIEQITADRKTYDAICRTCACRRWFAIWRSTTPRSASSRRRRSVSDTSWKARITTGGGRQ